MSPDRKAGSALPRPMAPTAAASLGQGLKPGTIRCPWGLLIILDLGWQVPPEHRRREGPVSLPVGPLPTTANDSPRLKTCVPWEFVSSTRTSRLKLVLREVGVKKRSHKSGGGGWARPAVSQLSLWVGDGNSPNSVCLCLARLQARTVSPAHRDLLLRPQRAQRRPPKATTTPRPRRESDRKGPPGGGREKRTLGPSLSSAPGSNLCDRSRVTERGDWIRGCDLCRE